jgi:hypothetical protein
LACALLFAPAGLALHALSCAYAEALGSSVAQGLSALLAPVGLALSPPPQGDVFSDLAAVSTVSSPIPSGATSAHAAKRGHKSGVAHAVHISSAQVLSLASRRAIPAAAPVRANAAHPAGLLLRGVSALGVGLEDGDVLTEAAGQTASSVAAVVGIVLAARARHSSEISGRFFRAGVPYLLTVEQPYPPGS